MPYTNGGKGGKEGEGEATRSEGNPWFQRVAKDFKLQAQRNSIFEDDKQECFGISPGTPSRKKERGRREGGGG